MNKILLRLAQTTNQQAIIIAFVLTAVFYFLFYDSGEDLDRKITQVETEWNAQNTKIKESEAALKKLENIRASVASLHEQFMVASHQLPSDIKASEILKTVDTLARSAGVNIKSTEPRPSTKEQIVERMPLHVVMRGTYSEITMFLYYISIMERITRINSFTLAPVPVSEGEKIKAGSLIFEGDILSYRYIEEVAANKTPGAPK